MVSSPARFSQWKAAALQGLPTLFERSDGGQAAEKAAHDKQTVQLYNQVGGVTIFTQRLWRTVKYEEVYLHDSDGPVPTAKGWQATLSSTIRSGRNKC